TPVSPPPIERMAAPKADNRFSAAFSPLLKLTSFVRSSTKARPARIFPAAAMYLCLLVSQWLSGLAIHHPAPAFARHAARPATPAGVPVELVRTCGGLLLWVTVDVDEQR